MPKIQMVIRSHMRNYKLEQLRLTNSADRNILEKF